MSLRFTVGFALYDSPPQYAESIRAVFTALSLSIHHKEHLGEIVIVDNSRHPTPALWQDDPKKPGGLGQKLNGLLRYVHFPEPQGTSVPRNEVFRQARFDHVVCMDSHVLLYPDALKSLSDFYERERGVDCPDVIHGPMMTEAGSVLATHMNDQWRSEMWGTWAIGWEKGGVLFSPIDVGKNNIQFMQIDATGSQVFMSNETMRSLDLERVQTLGWSAHEQRLLDIGARRIDRPFTIPGHGMGLFACRRDSWLQLPFSDQCRGFGGEEMTTGLRFRMAGHRSWCLPGLKWWHHFERIGGGVTPYRLTTWDKIRNYVIEFRRMGLDLDSIRKHFTANVCSEGEWQQILSGVEWPKEPAPDIDVTTLKATPEIALQSQIEEAKLPKNDKCKGAKKAPAPNSIDALYALALNAKSPINVDLPQLKHLAATCGPNDTPGVVVEVVHQTMSAIGLLAGRPRILTTFGAPEVGRSAQLKQMVPNYNPINAMPNGTIPPCDMLFLDVDPHSKEYYEDLLVRYSPMVRRYVVIHDTIAYGEKYNDGLGVLFAVSNFLSDQKWSMVKHYTGQNGLMVLSRYPADREKPDAPADEIPVVSIPKDANAKTVVIPDFGPGTEVKAIFASLGIEPSANCDCNAKAAQMNLWGIQGCKDNFNTIVAWFKDGQERWGWKDKLKAAALAVTTGLAWRVHPTNPFPGIVDLAIKRAEEKQSK